MYTVQLLERDFVGRPIDSAISAEVFPSLAQASAAARSEAFYLSHRLGIPVAVAIADAERTLIRHIVPALHDEHARPLYGGAVRAG
ncbi:hypothetical protein ACFOED_00450 [Vulcaniibacterium thermophilum]|uniref:hypothetical protein n=1 Tax=Vulcaniibacterium thermophilum TaxID=1169913 RepID=UPI0011B7E4E2|nr:hypothetical protein [Vulcaniibacterium thermophilum]